MKWFKHYSNASISNSLTEIIAKYGLTGYGRYWLLLEKMCEKFDGETDNKFTFSTKDLRDLMGFHRTQDLIKFLSSLDQVGIMSHTSKDQVIEIYTDILLRLQGRDYKKARSERAETAPKIKREIKIKNKNNINTESSDFFSDTMRLIQIYDSVLCDKKGMFKGTDLPPRAKKAFLESSGFMPSEKNWIDLFELVKNSDHLCESSWCNLTWLVDYDNAMKVLQGAFDSFDEKTTIDREFTVEDIRKHLEATK